MCVGSSRAYVLWSVCTSAAVSAPYHPSGLHNQAGPASCLGAISAPSGPAKGVIGCLSLPTPRHFLIPSPLSPADLWHHAYVPRADEPGLNPQYLLTVLTPQWAWHKDCTVRVPGLILSSCLGGPRFQLLLVVTDGHTGRQSVGGGALLGCSPSQGNSEQGCSNRV